MRDGKQIRQLEWLCLKSQVGGALVPWGFVEVGGKGKGGGTSG